MVVGIIWTPSAPDSAIFRVAPGFKVADPVLLQECLDRRALGHLLRHGDHARRSGRRLSASRVGSSLTQGAHQLAHRLTSSGLPSASLSVAGSSSAFLISASGKGLPAWLGQRPCRRLSSLDLPRFRQPARSQPAAEQAPAAPGRSVLSGNHPRRDNGRPGRHKRLEEAGAEPLAAARETARLHWRRGAALLAWAGAANMADLQPAEGQSLPVKPLMARATPTPKSC
jgi:hypothetical protein